MAREMYIVSSYSAMNFTAIEDLLVRPNVEYGSCGRLSVIEVRQLK